MLPSPRRRSKAMTPPELGISEKSETEEDGFGQDKAATEITGRQITMLLLLLVTDNGVAVTAAAEGGGAVVVDLATEREIQGDFEEEEEVLIHVIVVLTAIPILACSH